MTTISKPQPPQKPKNYTERISVAVTLCGLLLLSIGFHTKSKFVNGNCCDMTYSRRAFAQVDVDDVLPSTNVTHPKHYKLYKFYDVRDPRHDQFRDKVSKCHDNPGHPVLFVPGHWGNYDQARSLGAHGIRLTGKDEHFSYKQLRDRFLNENSSSFMSRDGSGDRFLYDVYAVDFGSEASGVHASLLHSQALYVDYAIDVILNLCKDKHPPSTSVTIVAHSIGGIVARAVPLLVPSQENKIRTVITLASPHRGLPYTFEETVGKLQKDLNAFWKKRHGKNRQVRIDDSILFVSISGGQRDELLRQEVMSLEKLDDLSVSVSSQASD